MNVTLLGMLIGEASGWDEAGDYDIMFYDFKSRYSDIIPNAFTMVLKYNDGLIDCYTIKEPIEPDKIIKILDIAYELDRRISSQDLQVRDATQR